jgi:hypothetical protein
MIRANSFTMISNSREISMPIQVKPFFVSGRNLWSWRILD